MLLCASAVCSANNSVLVVESVGGDKVTFSLSSMPQITFSNQTMLITTGSQVESFELANVAQYYFESETDGIQSVPREALLVRYAGGDEVVLQGLSPSARVTLYSADGRQRSVPVTYGDGSATLSLASLPQGVYILSANNSQTIKIYKR